MSSVTELRVRARGYPPLLARIPDAPPRIYVRGRLDPERVCVAIVGSRDCSSYGAGVARSLAGELAARGIVIVSGLARGIDAAAHEGALGVHGETVAVLPQGVLRVYPPRHRGLADRIVASGALVAEDHPGEAVAPWHFPRRNRLIAGLSLAVVVVEAAARSGARITADLALDYDREVLIVPGPITSRTSAGCHAMLEQGARVCTGWEDVLEQLPVPARDALLADGAAADSPRLGNLTGDARDLWKALDRGGRLSLQALVEITGLTPTAALTAITRLEIRGAVRVTDGGVVERVAFEGVRPGSRSRGE